MSKSYGTCVGCADAIKWVQGIEPKDKKDAETKERVIHRMQYEFDKDNPVPVRFRRGLYGSKYDEYLCGNCGYTVSHHTLWKYCANCGFAIDWSKRR